MVTATMKPEDVGRKAMTNLDSVLKKNKDITADKGLYSQAYDLFSIHIQL